jgi:hypothetical protein
LKESAESGWWHKAKFQMSLLPPSNDKKKDVMEV